jgi:transcription antitermination factor NusG
VNLTKGTPVRIIGGDFEGMEGVFIKIKGKRDRRVVVAIQGVIAVAIATIHPDLIQIINPSEGR